MRIRCRSCRCSPLTLLLSVAVVLSLLLLCMHTHPHLFVFRSKHKQEKKILNLERWGTNRVNRAATQAAQQKDDASRPNDADTPSYDDLLALYLKRLADIEIDRRNIRNSTCVEGKLPSGPCFNRSCTASFAAPNQRLRSIIESRYPITADNMSVIDKMTEQSKSVDITFITAGSNNHFRESQGLLKGLLEDVFPFLKNFTSFTFRLVYYDLGLTHTQVLVLQKHCRCSVLPFPFASLPHTFSLLGTCAWKPVMMKAHLRRSKYVIWIDASARFQTPNITAIIRHAEKWGVYVSRNSWMLPQHVAKPMLDYFKVQPCLLSPFFEMAGGFLVFKQDKLVERAILDPWLSCAFSPDCLCPGKNCLKMKGPCKASNNTVYSVCHRFDQSALAVILISLFDYRTSGVVGINFGHFVKFSWGEKLDYFPAS